MGYPHHLVTKPWTVGDRTHRPGTHKPNGKPWPISGNLPLPEELSNIQNSGGLSFCQEFWNTDPMKVNGFCDKYLTYYSSPWHTSSTEITCGMIKYQCNELTKLMKRRRSACTKSLLEIFNPKRKWKLKPHHQARLKYCRKIVKLRNPYVWCKKNCASNERGNRCRQKKAQCTCKLNKWLANNRALVSGDRSGIRCNPLPKGVTEMPSETHPLNDVLRCGPRVCDYIPGSELPWCEVGAGVERSVTSADSNYVSGNQQFAPWTSGSGSCNMCKCSNGIVSVGDDCPSNGDHHCAACSDGFVLNENNRCE